MSEIKYVSDVIDEEYEKWGRGILYYLRHRQEPEKVILCCMIC